MRLRLTAGLVAAACLAPGIACAAEWQVTLTVQSGNATTCGSSHATKFWVLQDGNSLKLTNPTKRTVNMAVPLQPDGSAAVEVPIQFTTRTDRVRVTLPPGSDRRRFEYLSLREACVISVDPV